MWRQGKKKRRDVAATKPESARSAASRGGGERRGAATAPVCVAVAILAFLLYFQSIAYDFALDDLSAIQTNDDVLARNNPAVSSGQVQVTQAAAPEAYHHLHPRVT